MSQEVQDEARLRKDLLGELTEAEQEALEQQLLTDNELFEQLPMIEDEVIDDYLSDELSASEREGFENRFLAAPERRRKLSFALSLRRYVTAQGETTPSPVSAESTSRANSRGT